MKWALGHQAVLQGDGAHRGKYLAEGEVGQEILEPSSGKGSELVLNDPPGQDRLNALRGGKLGGNRQRVGDDISRRKCRVLSSRARNITVVE